MKNYAIEHIGIAVADPIAMATWYQDVLGFKIRYAAHDDEKAVAFITDSLERTVIELGRLPQIDTLSGRLSHHLQFHIALQSENPEKDKDVLVAHGASFVERCPVAREGDYLLTLKDPWGNCIQLVKRGKDI